MRNIILNNICPIALFIIDKFVNPKQKLNLKKMMSQSIYQQIKQIPITYPICS